jgi:hypothetical protein
MIIDKRTHESSLRRRSVSHAAAAAAALGTVAVSGAGDISAHVDLLLD